MGELKVVETRKSEARDQVVGLLRSWLAMAERGELTCVALAGVSDDDCAVTMVSTMDRAAILAGAVAYLQHELMERWGAMPMTLLSGE